VAFVSWIRIDRGRSRKEIEFKVNCTGSRSKKRFYVTSTSPNLAGASNAENHLEGLTIRARHARHACNVQTTIRLPQSSPFITSEPLVLLVASPKIDLAMTYRARIRCGDAITTNSQNMPRKPSSCSN
jgi:hypothetical protein